MIVETLINGNKAIQHKILCDTGLFHAHFLKETTHENLESILNVPVMRARQDHTDIVEIAPFEGISDGLITKNPEKALAIRHADCQAAIFWDPENRLLACVHAGWRGQVSHIYTKTVDKMKTLGSRPEKLYVGISPSLGSCHSEFQGWTDYFPPYFRTFQIKENHFDLKRIAKRELIAAGLNPRHISIAPDCTASDPDRFHSWRRDKTEQRLVTAAYILAR